MSSKAPSNEGVRAAAAAAAIASSGSVAAGEGKASATKRKKKATPEKRLKRHRPRPTIKILERIERAISQRLYLVHTSDINPNHPHYGGPYCELAVLGSTGNLYTVTLCKIPHCDCPDHAKGNLCKHILFVMLKVVGLSSNSDLVYQAALLTTELEEIFNRMQQRRDGLFGNSVAASASSSTGNTGVVANESVRESYARITGNVKEEDKKNSGDEASSTTVQRKPTEGDCPICFDPLGESTGQLTFCQSSCGTNFHSQCMRMWTSQSKSSTGKATCPACRQVWVDVATGGVDPKASAAKKRKSSQYPGDEGYTNLGALQGQSPERDTSTYHSYSPGYGGRRGRYW